MAPGGFSSNGSNSIFSTIIASTGGGSGGIRNPAFPGAPGTISGTPGGSGGGAGTYSGAGSVGSGNTPPVSPGQGNNGGSGTEAVPQFLWSWWWWRWCWSDSPWNPTSAGGQWWCSNNNFN